MTKSVLESWSCNFVRFFKSSCLVSNCFLHIHLEMADANQSTNQKGRQSVHMDALKTPGGGKKGRKNQTSDLKANSSWSSSHTEQLSRCCWYHRAHTETHPLTYRTRSPAQCLAVHCTKPLIISCIGVWQ